MKQKLPYTSILTVLIALLLMSSLSSCSIVFPETEDTAYLTPIPEETLWLIPVEKPIRHRFDATVAARQAIATTRIHPEEPLHVIYVEKQSFGDAAKRLNKPVDRSADLEVWLVVFKGKIQIVPPMSEPTPGAGDVGCAYAIIDSEGNSYSMGTVSCKNFE